MSCVAIRCLSECRGYPSAAASSSKASFYDTFIFGWISLFPLLVCSPLLFPRSHLQVACFGGGLASRAQHALKRDLRRGLAFQAVCRCRAGIVHAEARSWSALARSSSKISLASIPSCAREFWQERRLCTSLLHIDNAMCQERGRECGKGRWSGRREEMLTQEYGSRGKVNMTKRTLGLTKRCRTQHQRHAGVRGSGLLRSLRDKRTQVGRDYKDLLP